MLVDEFMPVYDVSDVVATIVDADLATTWATVMDVDLIEVVASAHWSLSSEHFGFCPTSSATCCTANFHRASQSTCGSAISQPSRLT